MRLMNAKTIGLLGLLAGVLGLGYLWYHTKEAADADHTAAVAQISTFSNNLVSLESQLAEQKQVNRSLETTAGQRAENLLVTSNKWAAAAAALEQARIDAAAAAAAARAELAKRDERIGELSNQNDELTKTVDTLKGQIASLDVKIRETEGKLAASDGDRGVLRQELQRLLAEKADLEHKLTDLAFLRTQVRKIRDEIAVAQRLEFMRRGPYDPFIKGGVLLNRGVHREVAKNTFEIKAEVGTDGAAKVRVQTNAPTVR